jgi:hypothetical protein
MNYTLVILGVILLVVIYILYSVISEKGKIVSKKIDLTTSNGTIGYNTLSNPTASRFSLSLWTYIETLNPSGNTEIFSIKNGANTFVSLYVSTTASLKCDIRTTSGLVTSEITSNFPLQKWNCIVISVDNKVLDFYMDGKLIRSQQLDNSLVATNKDTVISYGACVDCKGYIANFERIPQPMDPATAWNKYMNGNGGNYFSKLLSSYGGTFTVTKDDLDLRQFTLF